MILAAILWPLPWAQWRLATAVIVGSGVFVTIVMFSWNPERFYRRCLSFVLPLGIAPLAGVTFEAGGTSNFAAGFLHWNGEPSMPALIVWAVVVLGFLIADVYQRRRG